MNKRNLERGHQATIDFVRMGTIIKQARINAGMTQEQLSEIVDVTPAFIGHIERGERSVSLKTLFAIACKLDISFDYLLLQNVILDDTQQNVSAFEQLIKDKSPDVQKAILDIVRTTIKYI